MTTALIQTRIKRDYSNAVYVRISLEGLDSKIWKVSRCRPAVSNETILVTRQECFVTKVARVLSITDLVLLINAAFPNVYFILHYHLHFQKELYFFECLYISEYDVQISSFKVNIYSHCFLLKPYSWNSRKVKREVITSNWSDDLPR